jgi:hypothetical protein
LNGTALGIVMICIAALIGLALLWDSRRSREKDQ